MEHLLRSLTVVLGSALTLFGLVSVGYYTVRLHRVTDPQSIRRLRVGRAMQAIMVYIAAYGAVGRYAAFHEGGPLTFRDFGTFSVEVAVLIAAVIGTRAGVRLTHEGGK